MNGLIQILAPALTVTSILVAIWIYFRNRQYRSIACIYNPLVSPIEIREAGALKGDFEIRFNKKPVKNIFIARMKIRNAGTLAIRQVNIVDPITFTFPLKTSFLRVPTVVDKNPFSLKVQCTPTILPTSKGLNKATVQFDLLNPGDEFTLEFICTGPNRYPFVAGHIEGVKEIKIVDPDTLYNRTREFYKNTASIAVIVAVVSLAVSFLPLLQPYLCSRQPPLLATISLQPAASASVGQAVQIFGSTNTDICFRAMRLEVDSQPLFETTSQVLMYKWDTSTYAPGIHTMTIKVAKLGDYNFTHTLPLVYKYDLK